MTSHNTARERMARGQSALVPFKRGSHFRVHSNGEGEAGNWVPNPGRAQRADRVVVCLRHSAREVGGELWRASQTRLSKRGWRHSVLLADLRLAGQTKENWHRFVGSQNPIRYVRHPAEINT